MAWTGQTPFEIRDIRAVPGGFELEFTGAVDPKTAADPASYEAKGFTYIRAAVGDLRPKAVAMLPR